MLRNTCMDPVGAIRPDYVAYAGGFRTDTLACMEIIMNSEYPLPSLPASLPSKREKILSFCLWLGAPVFIEGAPLGSVCIFSRRTLKDLGWSAHHTAVLRGLADAASTEVGDGLIHKEGTAYSVPAL